MPTPRASDQDVSPDAMHPSPANCVSALFAALEQDGPASLVRDSAYSKAQCSTTNILPPITPGELDGGYMSDVFRRLTPTSNSAVHGNSQIQCTVDVADGSSGGGSSSSDTSASAVFSDSMINNPIRSTVNLANSLNVPDDFSSFAFGGGGSGTYQFMFPFGVNGSGTTTPCPDSEDVAPRALSKGRKNSKAIAHHSARGSKRQTRPPTPPGLFGGSASMHGAQYCPVPLPAPQPTAAAGGVVRLPQVNMPARVPAGPTICDAKPSLDLTRKRKASEDDVNYLRKLRVPRAAFERSRLEAWAAELNRREEAVNRQEQTLRKITAPKQDLLSRAIPNDIKPLQAASLELSPLVSALRLIKEKEYLGQSSWSTTKDGMRICSKLAIATMVKFLQAAAKHLTEAIVAPLRNLCLSSIIQSLAVCKYVTTAIHILNDLDLPCDFNTLMSATLGRHGPALDLPGLPEESCHMFTMKTWLVYSHRQLLVMLSLPGLAVPAEELKPIIGNVMRDLYQHQRQQQQQSPQAPAVAEASYSMAASRSTPPPQGLTARCCTGDGTSSSTSGPGPVPNSNTTATNPHQQDQQHPGAQHVKAKRSPPPSLKLPFLVELSSYHNLPDLAPFNRAVGGCSTAAADRFESHLR